jgi:broad specificity phosphatase PhoE
MSVEKIHHKLSQSRHPDKVKFWFVRHEESEGNIRGAENPVMHDTPLTETGKQRAKRIANYLLAKSVHVTHVYSSAKVRGEQTATYIADAFGLPVIVKEELNERDWGEFKDLPWKMVSEKLAGLSIDDRFKLIPKDGESWEQMEKRVLRGLEEIAEEAHDGEDIIIVTHKGTLRALLPILAKAARSQHESFSVELGLLSVFNFDKEDFDFLNLLPEKE